MSTAMTLGVVVLVTCLVCLLSTLVVIEFRLRRGRLEGKRLQARICQGILSFLTLQALAVMTLVFLNAS